MKLDDICVVSGTRPRRKGLLGQARLGLKKVRLVRRDRKYLVAVHHGPVYVTVCSPEFSDKTSAIAWCERKTLQTPPTRSVQDRP